MKYDCQDILNIIVANCGINISLISPNEPAILISANGIMKNANVKFGRIEKRERLPVEPEYHAKLIESLQPL